MTIDKDKLIKTIAYTRFSAEDDILVQLLAVYFDSIIEPSDKDVINEECEWRQCVVDKVDEALNRIADEVLKDFSTT